MNRAGILRGRFRKEHWAAAVLLDSLVRTAGSRQHTISVYPSPLRTRLSTIWNNSAHASLGFSLSTHVSNGNIYFVESNTATSAVAISRRAGTRALDVCTSAIGCLSISRRLLCGLVLQAAVFAVQDAPSSRPRVLIRYTSFIVASPFRSAVSFFSR